MLIGQFGALARMVKIEHSVFALPFAFAGAFLAADGMPGTGTLLLLTVAMVAVRSFAMGLNRMLDLSYDRKNPRTSQRPLVTGEVTRADALAFITLSGAVFLASCAAMNGLALALAVPALLWSGFYSLTKRFTPLCHFHLGTVLGLAPLAGWISVNGSLATALPAGLMAAGVTLWTAGFDIFYAAQDVEFDRFAGLHSMPERHGIPAAFLLAAFSHAVAALLFLFAGWSAGLGAGYYVIWAGVAAVLAYEHSIISPDDLRRVNSAFFTCNGVVAAALFLGVVLGLFL